MKCPIHEFVFREFRTVNQRFTGMIVAKVCFLAEFWLDIYLGQSKYVARSYWLGAGGSLILRSSALAAVTRGISSGRILVLKLTARSAQAGLDPMLP